MTSGQIALPRKLVDVFAGEALYRGAYGGRGSAKSRSFAKMAAVHGLRCAQAKESGVIVCGREFQNSLDDSSMAEVKQAIESEPWLRANYEIGEKYIRTLDGRIDFLFVGLRRNIESVKSTSRIRLLWVDEAEPVSELAWMKAIPTVREEGAEIWVTWNPERRASATNQRFRESPPTSSKIIEVNWRDNPWFPAVLDSIRTDDEAKRPDTYGHIWEGEYALAHAGAYYASSLREALQEGRIGNVARDPLLSLRAYCDLGGTGARADAFAMWVCQFVGREIRVLDYYEAVGQPLATHIEWLRDRGYGKADVYLPHDGATHDRVFDVSFESAFGDAGFTVEVIPNQGRGAAKARIEAARRLFPSVWFHAETTEAGRDALGWYHEKRSDDHREVGLGPEHDFSSHGCFHGDTLVLTRYGTCPIRNLPENGEVLTPCGWTQYEKPRMTKRAASLVEVVFTGGYTVRCTPDHLFLTVNGWTSAASLLKGTPIQSTLTRSRSFSMVVFTVCGRANGISQKVVRVFTETFGRWLSGQSPRIAMSTTAMATYATTGSTIWSASPLAIISGSSGLPAAPISPAPVFHLTRASRPRLGTVPRKAGYGTADMPLRNNSGLSVDGKPGVALTAVRSLARWCGKALTRRFTARRRASSVRTIESVRSLSETADVWDITVPGPACFSLANGAVVHNSDAFGLMCVAYESPRGIARKIKYPSLGLV